MNDQIESTSKAPGLIQKSATTGRFFGVGVGPGDPELLTLKAARLILNAEVVCYLANEKGESQARMIAVEAFKNSNPAQVEMPIVVPILLDRTLANRAYDEGAEAIRAELDQGRDVVFICEGDPMFFGSFAYLLERLQDRYCCQVVPGISSVHAAASALQLPLTMLRESFAVISGRHTDQQIRQALLDHDSVVIMKAGQARPRILALLTETDRLDEANYLEYIGRDNERILHNVAELADEPGPYFSIFVVIRQQRDRG